MAAEMTAEIIRVIQYGLGPIGRAVAAAVHRQDGMELVGAVEIDPTVIGKKLGEVIEGCDSPVRICGSLSEVLRERPDAAIHCTSSRLSDVAGQFTELLQAGLHVVSTCEELAYPWYRFPDLAERLHSAAGNAGKALTGAGVNPGFAMDLLPLCLNHSVLDTGRIRVERVLDAGKRRGPLQLKVGAGRTRGEFESMVREQRVGHAGFIESVAMLAAGLGWRLDEIQQRIDPVIAEDDLVTGFVTIPAGRVAGINQTARGYRNREAIITFNLQMYIGAPESYDLIRIDGTPPLEILVRGGIPGDSGTVASTLNTLRKVINSGLSGLVTVKDLPASLSRELPMNW